MKKSTVVKLYNEFDNKEILKKALPRMINVKGNAEYIFYDLCIKYNDILNSDILDHFISISTFSSSLDDNLERKKLLNGIYNVLDNDYLVSNMDFNIILENIEYIMGTMFSKVFDVYDEDEEKYYISEIIIELSKGLSKSKDYDINKIYDHELKAIFEKFFDLLEDLNNTNVPKNEDYNKTLMDRVKAFLDIIFSKEIYELDDYKYDVVLDMASTIEDINELSKHKKKIVFYSRLTDEDFEVNLDNSVDTLTGTSIKLLKEGKSKILKFPENSSNNK